MPNESPDPRKIAGSSPVLLPSTVENEFCKISESQTDAEFQANWERRKKFRKLQALADQVNPEPQISRKPQASGPSAPPVKKHSEN